MGLSAEQLRSGLDSLAASEPAIAAAIARVGYPEPRIRDRGYATLLRTIIGQQVSVQAAAAIWNKLTTALGDVTDPAVMAAASDEALRAAGLSRQKASYARSLADEVTSQVFAGLDDKDVDQLRGSLRTIRDNIGECEGARKAVA